MGVTDYLVRPSPRLLERNVVVPADADALGRAIDANADEECLGLPSDANAEARQVAALMSEGVQPCPPTPREPKSV